MAQPVNPSSARVANELSESKDWSTTIRQLADGIPLPQSLDQHGVEPRGDLLEAIYSATLEVARTDLQRAGRLGAAALRMAEDLGDARSLGMSARAMANVHYLQGQYTEALAYYQTAIEHFQRSNEGGGDALEVARTQNSAIQTLAYLARYSDAISWAEQARAVFDAHGDEARLARLDGNLANLYFRLDRFDEALATYERALAAFRRVGSPQDIAAVLSNLATCSISVGRFADALRVHQEAREHCARHGFSLLVAQADYNIAYLHLHRGDIREAMSLYAAAREHCARAGDFYHATLCDLDQAELMLEVNLLSEAERLARRAMQGFRKLEMRYERAKATVFLATALARRQESTRAWQAFLRARRLFTVEGNRVWTAFIDLHLGLMNLQGGNAKRALARAQHALLVLEQQQVPGKWILAQLVLARIHIAMGKVSLAEDACQSALRRAEAIESPSMRFACQSLLGDVLWKKGEFWAARKALEDAGKALDLLRAGVPGEELRVAFFQDKAEVFERLALLYLDTDTLPRDEAAGWASIQSAKSRSLLDLLGQALHVEEGATAEPATLEAARTTLVNLRRQLHESYVSASDAELRGLPEEAERWRAGARVLESRLEEERAQLRLLDGRTVAGIESGETQRVTLDYLRGVLRPGEVFLEYFVSGSRVLVYVVTADADPVTVLLGDATAMRSTARLALFQISSQRYRQPASIGPGPGWPALANHLQRLHELLVEPLLRWVPPDAHTFIVAPHGFLHSLPFAALGPADAPLGGRYRIVRTQSASAYASTVAETLPRVPGEGWNWSGTALVLGVPDERVPLITDEVTQIATMLPGAQLRLGREASLETLRTVGARSAVIHIASHGVFRQDSPMFSSIRLGNGNLNLYELQEMRLPAQLVTLSGCSTGVHTVLGGDELMGLSRGFFKAGARNVMVTLWDVNDASTARFMTHFYAAYVRHGHPSLALKEAATEVRKQHPHPYHWAAFSLMVSGQASARQCP